MFRPRSESLTASLVGLDAPTKKKCGWLDRVFQSAAGLTVVFEEVPTLFKVQQKKEIITDCVCGCILNFFGVQFL